MEDKIDFEAKTSVELTNDEWAFVSAALLVAQDNLPNPGMRVGVHNEETAVGRMRRIRAIISRSVVDGDMATAMDYVLEDEELAKEGKR